MGLLRILGRKAGPLGIHDRFAAYIQLKSSNTQRSYTAVFKEWTEFLLHRRVNPLKPTERDVFAYTSEMLQKPGEAPRYGDGQKALCTHATVLRKVTILRGLYLTMPEYKGGTPFENAYKRLGRAKVGSKRPTEVASAAEVTKLLNSERTDSKQGIRESAIVVLLFGAGLRVSEMLSLNICDVRSESDIIFLAVKNTKAAKPGEQVLPDWAANRVNMLHQQRILEGAKPLDPLIVTYRGRSERPAGRMSVKTCYLLFKALCAKAGLPKTLSPHSGRATGATQLLLNGADYGSVRDWLRHSEMQMVSIYDHRLRQRRNHPGLKLNYGK